MSPNPEMTPRGVAQIPQRIGRYRLGPRLGSGGAASVYMACFDGPHGFQRLLALKIVHEHLSDQREFADMFLDEANLTVKLSHPNIVHTYELGREGERLFLAMEYLRGQPLSRVYRRALEHGQVLPSDVVAWIGAQAANALHYAHNLADSDGASISLVHRDVSPENLFVTYDGQIKLIDFGIARAEGRVTQTGLGGMKGKFRYMAPEQATGAELDHRVDIFGLGATLYEAALGRPVFNGKDEVETVGQIIAGEIMHPLALNPNFPDEMAEILLTSLSLEKEERYSDARIMEQSLRRFLGNCAARHQQECLAELMRELFRQEIVHETQNINTLQRDPDAASSEQVSDSGHTAIAQEVDILRPSRAPRSRSPIVLGMALVGALLAAVLRFGATASSPPSVVSEVPPAGVTIDISIQPPVEAVIKFGDQVVQERPARLKAIRSKEPITISAEAAGYTQATLQVVPDHDHFIVIPLVPVVVPASPPVPAVSEPNPLEPVSRQKSPRAVPAAEAVPKAPSASPPRANPAESESSVIKQFPL